MSTFSLKDREMCTFCHQNMTRKMKLGSEVGWIATFVGVFSSLVVLCNAESCSENIHHAMSQCFVEYNNLMHYLHSENLHFYKGMDVENLRSVCHTMTVALQCTHRKCKGMTHQDLLGVIPSDLKNVVNLCIYPQIYEVYARNRNCFLQAEPSLERCYNNYQAATEEVVGTINNAHSPGVHSLCSEFTKLVQCIKASVSDCSAEATTLVEHLSRPSVRFSEYCPKEGASTTEQTSPEPSPTMKNPSYKVENNQVMQQDAESSAISSHTLSITVFSMVLILTLMTNFLRRLV